MRGAALGIRVWTRDRAPQKIGGPPFKREREEAMRVGICLMMQNYGDYPRFEEAEKGSGDFWPKLPDSTVIQDGLRVGRLADELGFDSIWTDEHHFTPHSLMPDPTRLFSYFVGCTERVDFGTMVTVLPWHDPIRVAEGVVMLDNLSKGRNFFFGAGRGTAKREYDGFRISMDESRVRFAEGVEIIRRALTGERFSFQGKVFNIPELEIRPKPYSDPQKLLGNLYMAWGSPESMPIGAEMGLKALISPQRGWDEYKIEMQHFQALRERAGYAPAPPISVVWTVCAPTRAEAEEKAERHFREHADSAIRHYQLFETYYENTKDYASYAVRSKVLRETKDALGQMTAMFKDAFIWGTPEMCIEKLRTHHEKIAPSEVILPFHFGTVTGAEAEASMRLFAAECLPAVREFVDKPIVVDRDLPSRYNEVRTGTLLT
jgi:alkanesulfonate monooxygenase SsuD/methylene tetrahydromethanopterin reductase-like flavin-dependent oxidoreductase (luciferase family)